MPVDPEDLQALLNEMMKDKPSSDGAAADAQEALQNAMKQLQDAASQLNDAPIEAGIGTLVAGVSFCITIPTDLAAFVSGLVGSGRYVDKSDVIRDALRRMQCEPCFAAVSHATPGSIAGNIAQMAVPQGAMQSISAPMMWDRIQSTAGDLPPGAAGLMGLRRIIGMVERDIEVNRGNDSGPLDLSHGLGSEREYSLLLAPVADKESAQGWRLAPLRSTLRSVSDLSRLRLVLEELEVRMSDMSTMLSMRMQTRMDRRAKLLETLSNILKKLSESQDAIVQNMR